MSLQADNLTFGRLLADLGLGHNPNVLAIGASLLPRLQQLLSRSEMKDWGCGTPLVCIQLACEKLLEEIAAPNVWTRSGLRKDQYEALLRRSRQILGWSSNVSIQELAVQFGSIQLVPQVEWLKDTFVQLYSANLSAAQRMHFDPQLPAVLGVSFYLCCKASSVRVDKMKVIHRCSTTVREFDQYLKLFKSVVASQLEQLAGPKGLAATPRKTLGLRANSAIVPQTTSRVRIHGELPAGLGQNPSSGPRSAPTSPTLQRRTQGMKRKAPAADGSDADHAVLDAPADDVHMASPTLRCQTPRRTPETPQRPPRRPAGTLTSRSRGRGGGLLLGVIGPGSDENQPPTLSRPRVALLQNVLQEVAASNGSSSITTSTLLSPSLPPTSKRPRTTDHLVDNVEVEVVIAIPLPPAPRATTTPRAAKNQLPLTHDPKSPFIVDPGSTDQVQPLATSNTNLMPPPVFSTTAAIKPLPQLKTATSAITGITAMVPNMDYRRSKKYRDYMAWKKAIQENLSP
ncbi:Origin of replication complex subunit 6 [Dimargaris cristalligena]|uniref:Origin recognition complex subunit 6 n=1 Tax=Dimargaris cristalligena TaxID=215637 RepID=A0A4V1J5Q9_9FUNG|nr:Origin of replication complex subunit 6 [Dimargaris cristalligena]RKP39919.1 hypothetical protein BJ085DRAFT_37808 [Dimargaris cristalligena]|eukprot:RKP39919.1 hypothetical protein BJ085DRAFT_37808 [Dimargaris cristalligena]